MNRKILSVLIMMPLVCTFLSAAPKEKGEKSVGAENSWQETFDINDKSGKYNVYVTAEDAAGNQGIAGPFNIFIDAESDLPVAAITNPVQNMRVAGNLNIVGTCVDDDKVASVYIILDGNKENPILATGTDFWSYYLDTSELKEGPHTIEVYGIDDGNPDAYILEDGTVDASKVIPKTGHSVSVTWQLDRRAPVTKITNKVIGELVSGKMVLEGEVRDGNGIASLEYSTDGGVRYSPVKIKEVKLKEPDEEGLTSYVTFSLPLDTLKMKDGPTLCWFKAIDKAGSVGKSAFLYLVDNTPPEVKILTPEESEEVNGIVTVSGIARDTIQIKNLRYKWGNKSGEFTITEGNPYWSIEVDTRDVFRESLFEVTATDTMGNVVSVSRSFRVGGDAKKNPHSTFINQESDKPVVEIMYPKGDVESKDGDLYIRGIAKDDDGVAKVFYKIDNGEEVCIEATGVFYSKVAGELAYGKHKLTYYAVDKYGVKGNVRSLNFNAKGNVPQIAEAKYKGEAFVNGMRINPEADGDFEATVTTTSGLKSLSYTIEWGRDGKIESDVEISENAKKAKVRIPLYDRELPWGISRLMITATDIFDRKSTSSYVLNITDLTKINVEEAGVYFDDSVIAEDGRITSDSASSVSGYFAGGTIASVQTVPAIRGLSATASGNCITLTSAAGTVPFIVRVTTTSGARYDSKKAMYFPVIDNAPVLTLQDESLSTGVLNNFNVSNTITLSGTVSGQSSLRYRVLSATVNYDENGTVRSSRKVPEPALADAKDVRVDARRGTYALSFTEADIPDGVSIVEIIATSASGKRTVRSAGIRKITSAVSPELAGEGVDVTPAAPAYYWLHGDGDKMDYYGVCLYQGEGGETLMYKSFAELPLGKSTLDFKGATVEVNKNDIEITGRITVVDEKPYMSGMEIVVDRNGTIDTDPHVATFVIESNVVVDSVSFRIAGKTAAPLGELRVIEEGRKYEADVCLSGLSAGMTEVDAIVNNVATLKGHVGIVRSHVPVNSAEGIFWGCEGGAYFESAENRYVLPDGARLVGYANAVGTISAELAKANASLEVAVEDNVIYVSAKEDGVYSGISVKAANEAGGSWTSSAVNLIADKEKPVLAVSGFENMAFVQNSFNVAGTVKDGNGIRLVEYRTDEDRVEVVQTTTVNEAGEEIVTEETHVIPAEWKEIKLSRDGSFSVKIDVKEREDGAVPLDIRAYDNSGRVSYYSGIVYKDTVAPEVKIIVPEAGAKINGENLFVFSLKDAGVVETVTYTSPDKKISKEFVVGSVVDENNSMSWSLPVTHLGMPELPIDNTMAFSVRDRAGNTTSVSSFDFTVDPESDLPVVEIHTPAENAVLTTGFTISGVIYDDDGMKSSDDQRMCKVFFKVDNSAYQEIPNPDGLSSFEIVVDPITVLTDNEHVVTVYAEDMNGIRGREVTRNFRVSLDEPRGDVTKPAMNQTVKDLVSIEGWAQDKNGIGRIQISVDNGATYNDAVLKEGATREDKANWSYAFDTRVIQDGTHVVFIRIWDKYGIQSLYTSLVNVDNTAPTLKLELPMDDSTVAKNLVFSGQTTDNIGLTELYITVRSLEGKVIPTALQKIVLEPETIITNVIDISSLEDGHYNIELTGKDNAGNVTNVSRNIALRKNAELARVSLLYPLTSEHVNGEFNIYGSAVSENDEITKLNILIDGKVIPAMETQVSKSGYFRFRLANENKLDKKLLKSLSADKSAAASDKPAETSGGSEGEASAENMEEESDVTILASSSIGEYAAIQKNIYVLEPGYHTYQVVATTASGKTIYSNVQDIVYNAYGPWVTLDTDFTYGDFAVNRPLLKGKAGYNLTRDEKDAKKSKETLSEDRALLEAKSVKRVYLSFNNGRTYVPVSKDGKGDWEYRIENQDIAEGTHFLLVKAEMKNGENAITRLIVNIDRTLPTVKLISPGESGHYNQQLTFEGLSSDDIGLTNVNLVLRKGDKASYEVPGFIQGLYFDVSFWGATLWDVGVGLTAFDNAVKIQVDYGQFTQNQRDFVSGLLGLEQTNLRYGGSTVMGAKIIAQLAYLPFNFFLGHDFDWLSATASVGAHFAYFSDSGARQLAGSTKAQILSAALAQIEFPRVTFAENPLFKTWAFYIEPQVWFIPSDVANENVSTMVPTFSIGLRANVF